MIKTHWDDYRIAYTVAKAGTLSKAGQVLQMNHSTVLRHINRLEEALSVKLFIRHQRGYQLTDAGELMMREFPRLMKTFGEFEDLLSSAEKNISGNLRITTIPDYPHILNPALKNFRKEYPKLRIEIVSTDEVLSLARGEAHVSIRVGPEPSEADLIVKRLTPMEIRFYGSQEYIYEFGLPTKPSEFDQHYWALPSGDKRRIPFVKQILQHIKEDNIVYQSNNFPDLAGAVAEGMAVGPVSSHKAAELKNLTALDFMSEHKEEGLWFVYHKDLKNSARIQALYKFLSDTISN